MDAPQEPIGLIVVDHGSRRAESNAMLEQMVGQVAATVPYDIVEPAHMELAEPSIAAASSTSAGMSCVQCRPGSRK